MQSYAAGLNVIALVAHVRVIYGDAIMSHGSTDSAFITLIYGATTRFNISANYGRFLIMIRIIEWILMVSGTRADKGFRDNFW